MNEPGIVAQDLRVPLRDGVDLAADVLRPDDDRPHPALLVRTPYSRAAARAWTDPLGVARQGWAVVIQDCRGRFDSAGRFEPFLQEGADGADTIAWIAAQPWCNGQVASHGVSYLGMAQWLAALESPPALKAMAPLVAGWDGVGDWGFEGGAFQLGFLAPWALGFPATAPGAPAEIAARAAELAQDWEAFLRMPPAENPLCELFPPFRRWLSPGDGSELSVAAAYSRLDLPVFQVAGWYDIFVESALRHYQGMRTQAASPAARRSQRLVVGPWVHTGLYLGATAEFDCGPGANALAQDLPGEVVQWLGEALAGKDVAGGARVYVMGGWGQGEWRELDDWPPASTPLTFYLDARTGANSLRGDGRLVRTAPERAGQDRYAYDPDRPVPTRGGRTLAPVFPQAGPVDQRPVEARDDVLVYTSEPLGEDLVVIGAISAEVQFATTGRSADVTVKLCDVYPDGRAYNVVDSIRRQRFEPGEPSRVTVDVGSTAQRFRAGHRLRVEISSSNFPRFDRNPSDGRGTADATQYFPALQTVYRGGRQPSRIVLPVVRE